MTETVTVRKDDLRLLMEYAGKDIPAEDSEHEVNVVLARCGAALAGAEDRTEEGGGAAPRPSLPDGQWLAIAFMGRIEYDDGAYVREVTRNGQPAYRVELPDYVFGGDVTAVRHHAASAWFGDRPVSEASVRKAWEAKQEAARLRRKREAAWERQQAERRALPAGGDDASGDGGCASGHGDEACGEVTCPGWRDEEPF